MDIFENLDEYPINVVVFFLGMAAGLVPFGSMASFSLPTTS